MRKPNKKKKKKRHPLRHLITFITVRIIQESGFLMARHTASRKQHINFSCVRCVLNDYMFDVVMSERITNDCENHF